MSNDLTFDQVMAGLKAGDEQAQQEVWDRYVKRLKGLARKKLCGRLQDRVSDSTLAVSALKSFLVGQANGKFENLSLDDWNDIWSLLATITVRKYCNKVQYWTRQLRDVRREVSMGAESDDSEATRIPLMAIAAGLSPEQDAMRREQDEIFQKLLAEFRDTLKDKDQQIFDGMLEDLSTSEIADSFAVGDKPGLSESTVRHARQRILKKLAAMLKKEGYEPG